MILTTVSEFSRYFQVNEQFQKVAEYLKNCKAESLEPGKFTVDDLKVAIYEKIGINAKDAKAEAHDKAIDIQFCVSGTEGFGWKPRKDCQNPLGAYNPEKDIIFYQDQPDTYFELNAGQIAIFFPEDVHAPLIGEGNKIKKMVVKVKI